MRCGIVRLGRFWPVRYANPMSATQTAASTPPSHRRPARSVRRAGLALLMRRPLPPLADYLAVRAIRFGINGVLPHVSRAGAVPVGVERLRGLAYDPGAGLQLDLYRPTAPGPHPLLVGFHGGAWVLGRTENLTHAACYLARRGFAVALVQYRLAPRHPLPAPIEDGTRALAWLHARQRELVLDTGRVGVFGDSAGGHLSAALALGLGAARCSASSLPTVAAAVHWYGVFDFARFARVSYRRTADIMRAVFGHGWMQDPARLAQWSPITHLDTRPAPPTLLQVGTADPLLSQSRAYARALRAQGRPVQLEQYPGGVHGLINLWWQRDARRCLARTAAWFHQHLTAAPRPLPQTEVADAS